MLIFISLSTEQTHLHKKRVKKKIVSQTPFSYTSFIRYFVLFINHKKIFPIPNESNINLCMIKLPEALSIEKKY